MSETSQSECSESPRLQESRRDVVRLSKELEQARTDLEQTRKDNCAKVWKKGSRLRLYIVRFVIARHVPGTRRDLQKRHRSSPNSHVAPENDKLNFLVLSLRTGCLTCCDRPLPSRPTIASTRKSAGSQNQPDRNHWPRTIDARAV